MSKNQDVCYLCIRIPPEEVLRRAHLIWDDRETARDVAEDASLIIRECYEADPAFFCGRPSRAVLGGLFYLLGIEHGSPVTYRILEERLEVTQPTIRKTAKYIAQKTGRVYQSAKEFTDKPRRSYICPICSEECSPLCAIKSHLEEHDVASACSLRIADFDESGILKGAEIRKNPVRQSSVPAFNRWWTPRRFYTYSVVRRG